jgi:hypothetical protein
VASGPVAPDGVPGGRHAADPEVATLRAERDALALRCAAAEEKVEELTSRLAEAQQELHDSQEAANSSLSLFEGGSGTGVRTGGEQSDTRILSLVLTATAVVSAMVVLLALLNGNLLSVFGLFMLLLTAGLAWGAIATRVEPTTVYVTRGVVHIEQGDTKYRFDLSHRDTRIEQHGAPGDADWRVVLSRRHTGPFTVDATLVDPEKFAAQVEQYRDKG